MYVSLLEWFFILLMFLNIYFIESKELGFPICQRRNFQFNDCISAAVEKSLYLMKTPLPELGLPGLDPIKLDAVTIPGGTSKNFRIDQKLFNTKIYHIANTIFNKNVVDIGETQFKIVLHSFTPHYKIESDYEIDGQILIIPVSGNGKCHIEVFNATAVTVVEGNYKEKHGKRYLNVTDLKSVTEPALVTFDMENLFGGNEALGKQMNKLLNENWKLVNEEVGGAYNEILSVFFKNVAQKIFTAISLDEIFSP